MFCKTIALAMPILLAACVSPQRVEKPQQQLLERAFLACRSQQHLNVLHGAGERFQREADNHMADGRCRRFQQGSRVTQRSKAGFTDPVNGVHYLIYH